MSAILGIAEIILTFFGSIRCPEIPSFPDFSRFVPTGGLRGGIRGPPRPHSRPDASPCHRGETHAEDGPNAADVEIGWWNYWFGPRIGTGNWDGLLCDTSDQCYCYPNNSSNKNND